MRLGLTTQTVLAITAIVLASSRASADAIDYASGALSLRAGSAQSNYYDSTVNQLSLGPTTLDYTDYATQAWATGFAEVNPNSLTFMKFYAQSALAFNGQGNASQAAAALSFRDFISYGGSDHPSALHLTFQVAGSFTFVASTPYYWQARFGYLIADSFQGLYLIGSNNNGTANYLSTEIGSPDQFQPFGDAYTLAPGSTPASFVATFSADLPYADGGYGYVLSTTDIASVTEGGPLRIATGDLKDTISLIGISRPDGTPVDPSLLSFASGFQFGPAAPPPINVVPEPGTLSLLALGLGVMLTRHLRQSGGKGGRSPYP